MNRTSGQALASLQERQLQQYRQTHDLTPRPLHQPHAHPGPPPAAAPYPGAEGAESAGRGSLPALRTGTTPTPAAYATAAAITNPRASIPATTSKLSGP